MLLEIRSDTGESLDEEEVIFGVDERSSLDEQDEDVGGGQRVNLPVVCSSGVGARPSREATAVAAASALLAGVSHSVRRPPAARRTLIAPPDAESRGSVGPPVQQQQQQEEEDQRSLNDEPGGARRSIPAPGASFNFRDAGGVDGAAGEGGDLIGQSASDLLRFFGDEQRPRRPAEEGS